MAKLLERAASETQFPTPERRHWEQPDRGDASSATVDKGVQPTTYIVEQAGQRRATVILASDALAAGASWLADTLRKFVQLRDLRPDWDSHGGRPVDPATLGRALEIMLEIVPASAPPPHVVPSPAGGVQVEWHRPAADVELEFKVDGTASFYVETDEGEINESGPVARVARLAGQHLARIFGDH